MKTVFRSAAMLAALALFPAASPVFGQAAEAAQAAAAGLKIRFINFSVVLEGTEEAKLEISNVRSFIDEKAKAYDAKASELEKLKQQFAQQGPSLNAQTSQEMQRTITEQDKNLRRFQEDTQAEINTKRDALFQRLTGKIQPILGEYAQQHQISAIFFLDTIQGYFDPSLDVTQEIIRLYNEKNPPPATAAPSQE